ncbi:hypothetical protein V474_14020 [Novosphingobium barchaimii LL02]|uniref:Lysozyme inhibitor LprI-like N-terminal domain-containing protein n=1 Tax=Novosphingobium barchaimii LL02 TaxID=1114963 RepID=A0A0J7XYQ7_9SPHN|nr:hypothetical protein V474_14020 [Novosphingobium barchaimii LL02]
MPSFAEELGKDDPGWTAQCVKQAEQEGEGTGTLVYARCMVEHRERLQAAQTALVGRIGRVLAGKGPEGTDYKAAKSGFAEAQRHWTAFIGEDCAVVGDVFGYGTAQGLAGEECLIAHYTARNQQLRDLEANYLNP